MESNTDREVLVTLGRLEGKLDSLAGRMTRVEDDGREGNIQMREYNNKLLPLVSIVQTHEKLIASLQKDNESTKKWRWYSSGMAAAVAFIVALVAKYFPAPL